jgi:hypothetical protein
MADPSKTTAAGTPDWVRAAVGPIATSLRPLVGSQDIASVDPSNPKPQIIVKTPDQYTKPVAAHESVHAFQNTRNDDFQDKLRSLLPGTPSASDYDYGGIKGLQANPMKSMGQYNHEQQASMVEDLTQAQSKLGMHMTRPQLQQWDATKTALERPIRQLQAVPAEESGLSGTIDHFMHERGLGDPLSYAKSLMGLSPLIVPPANPVPDAPSVALGYANPSKLVR